MPSSSNFTGIDLVTPWSDRSPVTTKASPSAFTDVEVKVRSGNCSTSRKSADFKCASRSAFWVSMLAVFAVSAALEAAGLAPSRVSEPSNSVNRPRTLATMAWRAENPMVVCVGSICQVPVVAARSVTGTPFPAAEPPCS
jgi:hypothetical protein